MQVRSLFSLFISAHQSTATSPLNNATPSTRTRSIQSPRGRSRSRDRKNRSSKKDGKRSVSRGRPLAGDQDVFGGLFRSVPAYWQHAEGFHLVETLSVNDIMRQHMRNTSCGCEARMSRCNIVKVLRVENAPLWRLYVANREERIKQNIGTHTYKSLGMYAGQPRLASVCDLRHDLNEFYL